LAFVNPFPVFGGPHNQALQLDQPLRKRGWETLVVLPNEAGSAYDRLSDAELAVARLPLHRPRLVRDPRVNLELVAAFRSEVHRLRQHFREVGADVVMLAGLMNVQAAVAARLNGTPLVWQLLDTRVPRPIARGLGRFVSRTADCVMSTGLRVAEAHLDLARLGGRLVTFFPPVDTVAFAPDRSRRAAARTELGLSEDDLVVGSVANVNPQKDHVTFVRGAAELRRHGVRARFVILGAQYPQHASYARAVRDTAQSLGLEPGRDLIMVEPGDRVATLASALDVFWLTSGPRSEGIPTVVLEAMALAVPVVVTDVGAVREAVDEGVTGFVVPPLDYRSLASTTARFLIDESRRVEVGERARAEAVHRFSRDICADTHIKALEMAVTAHRHRAAAVGALNS
jgi:glycosyltransferase involved in cell wall biosynthesis